MEECQVGEEEGSLFSREKRAEQSCQLDLRKKVDG